MRPPQSPRAPRARGYWAQLGDKDLILSGFHRAGPGKFHYFRFKYCVGPPDGPVPHWVRVRPRRD